MLTRTLLVIALSIGAAACGDAEPTAAERRESERRIREALSQAGGGPAKTVRYEVTGSAQGADITYTDGTGSIEQQSGLSIPVTPGLTFRARPGTFVQISAQNTGATGDISCVIKADGELLDQARSVGGYVIASCSARVP